MGVDERLEIEGLARSELRVPVVEQELEEHADPARPLDGPEEEVDQAPRALRGSHVPHEGLGQEQDRLVDAALPLHQGADEVDFEVLPFARFGPEPRRTTQEE